MNLHELLPPCDLCWSRRHFSFDMNLWPWQTSKMLSPNPQYQYALLGANSTTQVKKTGGNAGAFIPSVTGTLALYDNAAGNTTVNGANPQIMAATTVTAGVALEIGAKFINGLVAVLAGGAAGTILFE